MGWVEQRSGVCVVFFFFKQKTAYEIGTGDWSSDVCSSDLLLAIMAQQNKIHGHKVKLDYFLLKLWPSLVESRFG